MAAAAAAAFPPRASEYRLLEEIGRGAFAVVYRAICKPLDVVVAVKRVDLETCNGSLVSPVYLRAGNLLLLLLLLLSSLL